MNYIEYRNVSAMGFSKNKKYYIYDRFSNNLFEVSKIIFKLLDDYFLFTKDEFITRHNKNFDIEELYDAYDSIGHYQRKFNSLIKFNFNFASISSRNSFDAKLNDKLNNHLNHLIFNVTEECNLRCEYCIYSGKYSNVRTHNSKNFLSWEIAEKALKLFFHNSSKAEVKTIAFYGGEPLLNFKIVKNIIDYSLKKDSSIKFTITTNGTLLKGNILKYLVSNYIMIIISLDGPKEIHDQNRRFKNQLGSFDTIMQNIKSIKEQYPEYYNKLRFNITLSPLDKINTTLMKFFNSNSLLSLKDPANLTLRYVNPSENTYYNDTSYIKFFKAYLKSYWSVYKKLHINGINSLDSISPVLISNQMHKEMTFFHFRSIQPFDKYSFYWPNGTCIPGLRSVFVSNKGLLFPCEKLYDNGDMIIGNVDSGLNNGYISDEVKKYCENINEICSSCWAFRLCGECWLSIRNHGEIDISERRSKCVSIKNKWKNIIENYIEIISKNPNAYSYLDEDKKLVFIKEMIED